MKIEWEYIPIIPLCNRCGEVAIFHVTIKKFLYKSSEDLCLYCLIKIRGVK